MISYSGHLENHLFKAFATLKGKKIALGFSGGADSLALLKASLSICKSHDINVLPVHIHHGPEASDVLFDDSVRTQAWQFCQKACAELEVQLLHNVEAGFFNKFSKLLKSESELRDYRRGHLQKIARDNNCELIMLAQHKEDQLETRLIQVIRGTGVTGFKAMSELSGNYYRPILLVPKADLVSYLKAKKLDWWEDPSNKDNQYLRNFIRNKWLPTLEEYRPGATSCLARSFDNLVEGLSQSQHVELPLEGECLNLTQWQAFDAPERKQLLVSYMKRNGVQTFSQAHVLEAVKRLDSSQKSYTFYLLDRVWTVEQRKLQIQSM